MHGPAEMRDDRLARALADALEPRATLADNDRFLAIALDQDLLVDDGRAVGSS